MLAIASINTASCRRQNRGSVADAVGSSRSTRPGLVSRVKSEHLVSTNVGTWTAAKRHRCRIRSVTHLQEKGDEALSANKLTGAANTIVKRVTKDQLVEAYQAHG